ncbi:AAA family ATPase [bacterium]|nr:AAA family ATPase [bacterium]
MKLKEVTIHKYKCIESDQSLEIENDISILVGMNESGKTAILETIAKTNYFQEDEDFKFNLTHDFPRKEKKKIDKSGTNPSAVTCKYELGDNLFNKIESELGDGVLKEKTFLVTTKFNNNSTWSGIKVNKQKFIKSKTKKLNISSKTLNEKLERISNTKDLDAVISEYSEEKYKDGLETLKPYFENKYDWKYDPIGEYVTRKYLKPNLPKFLYYDEYFSLPSRISFEKLKNETLDANEYKTARALVELADINIDDLLQATDFEDFIAELEATEAIISGELFKYWQTNKNLNITFQIDKKEQTDPNNNTRIVEHILDIRVKSKGVSLPLKNRSKGFNWFFSFLVWFKKIQEDIDSKYVLLLDEPGLNLHASAQADLLNFIEDLSEDYQIIFTTHSPFMIPSEKLHRIRTILETDKGSKISDSIQEKDPNTLFPLQAALGYNIAQNLFVSNKNLLVEGVSDLIYVQILSSILESEKRTHLRDDITIVPVGGLDKVSTFISLLRGSKLELVCLLDTFTDPKGKAKVEDLIRNKIIQKSKVRFFDEFLDDYSHADLEDLFSKAEYIKLFNQSFTDFDDIKTDDLNPEINQILTQINNFLNIDRFNHYRPANQLAKMGVDSNWFSETTLANFEKVFLKVNGLFHT